MVCKTTSSKRFSKFFFRNVILLKNCLIRGSRTTGVADQPDGNYNADGYRRGRRRHNLAPTARQTPSGSKHHRRSNVSPTATVGVKTPSDFSPRLPRVGVLDEATWSHCKPDGITVILTIQFFSSSQKIRLHSKKIWKNTKKKETLWHEVFWRVLVFRKIINLSFGNFLKQNFTKNINHIQICNSFNTYVWPLSCHSLW